MSKELTVDDIYRALKPLLNALSQLEIDNSPRSLRTWRLIYDEFDGRATDIYQRYPASDFSQNVNELSSEEEDALQENGEEEDQKGKKIEEPPALPQLSRKKDAHCKLVKRVEKIIGALEQAPDALIRDRTGKAAESIIAFCESSNSFDGEDKLLDRDENLRHSRGRSETVSYLSQILYKIDTIKCAWEWNSQRGPGSLNQKHAYNVALFQRNRPSDFRGLALSEKNNKMKELKSEYGEWMKSREGEITARNHLLKAWENTSQFGTGVLILRFFSVQNLGPRRAKQFNSLLDVLNNFVRQVEMDEDEAQARGWTRSRLDGLEEQNRAVIYSLTARLCCSEEEKVAVEGFLDQFYIRYPSKHSFMLPGAGSATARVFVAVTHNQEGGGDERELKEHCWDGESATVTE
ncbi:hypothetical protein GGX14DRAFT_672192 [Mycena pura]|uniref:Uncharacterized protein n=1 Tax=Mycena pura TaxID=153505 RepID=A0AAD6UWK3_9AGAR|nr:hypothetical protein GGX14DRAFT_672192 [Mycena pura]